MILGFKDGKIKSIINGIKIKTDLESNQMLFQQIWKRTKVPWYAYRIQLIRIQIIIIEIIKRRL